MSGNKCVFHQCGLSYKRNKSLRMFSFPVYDPERCKKWISHSGNQKLRELSPASLRRKRVCSNHFTEKQIEHCNLPRDAVPMNYLSEVNSVESDIDGESSLVIGRAINYIYSETNEQLIHDIKSGKSREEPDVTELQNSSITGENACSFVLNRAMTSKTYGKTKEKVLHEIKSENESDELDEADLQNSSVTGKRTQCSLKEENRQLRRDLEAARKKSDDLERQLSNSRKKIQKLRLLYKNFVETVPENLWH